MKTGKHLKNTNIKKNQENTPRKGADIVIESLERCGVDLVFAYPGGQSIELHQSLSRSGIRVVLPRHEQGGAFAAVGFARATGKTGVCFATSGPGATNLITGIADAYMDSIPTVFITGQVGLSFIGKNAFQETDIIGITRPIVKHSFLVLNIADIPAIISQAFELANSGRPGPVVVDIPKNIQQQLFVPEFPSVMHNQDYKPAKVPVRAEDIAALRKELKRAKAPCIYAGGGIVAADAAEELRKFARSWNIPVTTTIMALGTFPADDPLFLGFPGMHGSYAANYAVNECDLLLALGARFDDRVTGATETFAKDAVIVHVDIDLSEINKNKPADIGIVADVRDLLRELNKKPVPCKNPEWIAQVEQWKKDHPLRYRKTDLPQPQTIMETLHRLTGGKAVIVPGVGQHQMWAAQHYGYTEPRQFLTSGGLGSMGFGLPAAMGAKIACPEKTVVNVDGDGSFQMNIQELGTLSTENIPVKMIIMNNQTLGMVAQWEDRFYNSNRGNTDLRNTNCKMKAYPNFVTIAKGYGIPGQEVWTADELEDAIRTMLETDGPYLLDCHTGYNAHVLPMIPPGKTYKDIIED